MSILKKLFANLISRNDYSKLCNLYVLHSKDYVCDKCEYSDKDCKKLHLANTTICVCKKEDIDKFTKPSKKNKK